MSLARQLGRADEASSPVELHDPFLPSSHDEDATRDGVHLDSGRMKPAAGTHVTERGVGNSVPRLRFGLQRAERSREDHEVISEITTPRALAHQEQRVGVRIVGQPLDFASPAQPGLHLPERDVLLLLALPELVQRPVALDQVEALAGHRDALEVTADPPRAHVEPLDDLSAARLDLVDAGALVVVGEQPSVGGDGQAGHLAQASR